MTGRNNRWSSMTLATCRQLLLLLPVRLQVPTLAGCCSHSASRAFQYRLRFVLCQFLQTGRLLGSAQEILEGLHAWRNAAAELAPAATVTLLLNLSTKLSCIGCCRCAPATILRPSHDMRTLRDECKQLYDVSAARTCR